MIPIPAPVYHATLTSTPSGKDGLTDGDTMYLLISLVDGIMVRWRCRLSHVNAPEMSTPEGKEAKQFVQSWLPTDGSLVVYFHGRDNYGRALTEVFRTTDGACLNDDLLANGRAVPMSIMAQMGRGDVGRGE